MNLDEGWSALLDLVRAHGPVEVRRSRYAEKPAVFLNGREIAHWEAPGVVDLRITARGWRTLAEPLRADRRIVRDPKRRDWVELRLATAEDADTLAAVITAALTANH